jgi:hypothetical protein
MMYKVQVTKVLMQRGLALVIKEDDLRTKKVS